MLSDRNYRRISDFGTVVFVASAAHASYLLFPVLIEFTIGRGSEYLAARNEGSVPIIFALFAIMAAVHYLLHRFIPGHIPVLAIPRFVEDFETMLRTKIPSWEPLSFDGYQEGYREKYRIHRRAGFHRAVRNFTKRQSKGGNKNPWVLRADPDKYVYPCTLIFSHIHDDTINIVDVIAEPTNSPSQP